MANEQELPDDRKEKEEIIRNFRLMDDTFMSKVFEDKACAEPLLRIILGRDDLTVPGGCNAVRTEKHSGTFRQAGYLRC